MQFAITVQQINVSAILAISLRPEVEENEVKISHQNIQNAKQ